MGQVNTPFCSGIIQSHMSNIIQSLHSDIIKSLHNDIIKSLHSDNIQSLHSDIIQSLHSDIIQSLHSDIIKSLHNDLVNLRSSPTVPLHKLCDSKHAMLNLQHFLLICLEGRFVFRGTAAHTDNKTHCGQIKSLWEVGQRAQCRTL